MKTKRLDFFETDLGIEKDEILLKASLHGNELREGWDDELDPGPRLQELLRELGEVQPW